MRFVAKLDLLFWHFAVLQSFKYFLPADDESVMLLSVFHKCLHLRRLHRRHARSTPSLKCLVMRMMMMKIMVRMWRQQQLESEAQDKTLVDPQYQVN